MKIGLLFSLWLFFTASTAQVAAPPPCSAPQSSQFDFWVGDWTLTWSDTLHGTNHVEKILGSCIIQENFHDPNKNYSGKSWSAYNTNSGKWLQTWVDSQGGFIYLEGGMQHDSMVLMTQERTVPTTVSKTGKIKNRMVYCHITPNSFDWSWEASTDGGGIWKTNWKIHYERKSP
jgi:hypothetical protein